MEIEEINNVNKAKKHKERSRLKIPRTKFTNRQVHIKNKETERKAKGS